MNEIQNYSYDAQEITAQRSVNTEMAVSRQTQEVQAAIVLAKRFPRDGIQSYNRILDACKRKSLAERAVYEYPRGKEKVTGPSIRLAEVMAQNWGNLDFGITELEQRSGESTVMAYCWDLETNVRQTKIFTVPHTRTTKSGSYALTDPRDIYETIANQGARRMRSCILGIIPGDVVEAAVTACNRTLIGGDEPMIDRVRKMAQAFQEQFGVPLESLEKYIGCKAEAFTAQSVVRLRNVYTALAEGRAEREAYFDIPAPETAQTDAQSATDGEKTKSAKKVDLNEL